MLPSWVKEETKVRKWLPGLESTDSGSFLDQVGSEEQGNVESKKTSSNEVGDPRRKNDPLFIWDS